ncbi:MAG: tRNA pseudouridine synthase 1 [Bogoriella megaspora]|nr:MAG: tRNA pseudouridine synthase 1 [Bogoriella megaspora]
MAGDSTNHQVSVSSSNPKKRKWGNDSFRHGSKKHGDKRNKGRNTGRMESNRQDKRGRNEAENNSKRTKLPEPSEIATTLPKPFPEDEIAAEERRPKHKVAVLIGYSGSGYKGMQINYNEKTIEGDLFHSFVKAGAISKANANDPKKSSLVRCARTDKGVHAAGNVISLKLIVEDEDVVEKINSHLSPQIRVWGIERTIGSFSCYQACDSRWYEYLIPTYSLLPPHPSSFLAKECEKAADNARDRQGYEDRQADVKGFWQKVEEKEIKPMLDSLEDDIRAQVVEAMYRPEHHSGEEIASNNEAEEVTKTPQNKEQTSTAATIVEPRIPNQVSEFSENSDNLAGKADEHEAVADSASGERVLESADADTNEGIKQTSSDSAVLAVHPDSKSAPDPALLDAIKRLRAAYLSAKRRYRVPQSRISKLQNALSAYEGTHNFHNYTVRLKPRDPSAKRHIKSFNINPTPILKRVPVTEKEDGEEANGEGIEREVEGESAETEWLSLKVHGQSFMMHQIRKMIGLAVLAVRSGADVVPLIKQSYDWNNKISIPKAPGLGLLLERPVFDSYNKRVEDKFQERNKLSFEKHEKKMDEFKDREIYGRIFKEEMRDGVFHGFWGHVDNYKEGIFLYVTSKGLDAVKGIKEEKEKGKIGNEVVKEVESSDDDAESEGVGEGKEG